MNTIKKYLTTVLGIILFSRSFVNAQNVKPPINTSAQEQMQDSTFHINEVVVKGLHEAKPIKSTPITTQVINAKAMVDAGYGDIQKVLQQETPGLNIQKVGFGNEISMQGLDARHVLFLQDGEQMTGDMAGNLDYERFNLHAIDHIEIIKGASSTLYGSMASGAVINLISKKPTQPLDITAGFRWGQMNERNYKHPKKEDFLYMFEKNADRPNLQGWLSAGWKKGWISGQTDMWYAETDAFYLYQSSNDKKVYTAEANPFLDHDVTIVSSMPRPPMGVEGSEHLQVQQKIYLDPFRNFHAEIYGTGFWMNQYDMVQDLVFTQSYDYTYGAKASYTFRNWFTLAGSLHSDVYDRFKRHERRDERQKVYDSKISQPRLTLTSDYFPGHHIIFGVESFSDELTSNRFSGKATLKMLTRSLHETESYIQDEWKVKSHWMFSTGVRTDFSHQFGFMWVPKIAAKYSPDDLWSFRANYSKGYRSPSIKELFFNWDHLGMFMIKGNEYLRPEKNNYFSISTEFDNGTFFINTTLYANLFKNKIEGVWKIYDMQYNFEYTNLDKQNLIGGEILAKWRIVPQVVLNASYSYVNVSKENGLRINTTSPQAATGSIDYHLQKKSYQLLATFSTSIMGKKRYDVQDRLTVDGVSHPAYFRCELPAYALCNLNFTQTFHDKIKVITGIDNVFNYKPKTLGSGLTAFNVPATAGARCYVEVEFNLDKLLRRKNE